jgi:hypothetical protein
VFFLLTYLLVGGSVSRQAIHTSAKQQHLITPLSVASPAGMPSYEKTQNNQKKTKKTHLKSQLGLCQQASPTQQVQKQPHLITCQCCQLTYHRMNKESNIKKTHLKACWLGLCQQASPYTHMCKNSRRI